MYEGTYGVWRKGARVLGEKDDGLGKGKRVEGER
jgi:hypothetical protein